MPKYVVTGTITGTFTKVMEAPTPEIAKARSAEIESVQLVLPKAE